MPGKESVRAMPEHLDTKSGTSHLGGGAGIRGAVADASARVDGKLSNHTQSGKVTAIREDYTDKTLARIEVEYANGSSSKSDVPTLTDTITVSRKQSKGLHLGDRIKVTTTIERVG